MLWASDISCCISGKLLQTTNILGFELADVQMKETKLNSGSTLLCDGKKNPKHSWL